MKRMLILLIALPIFWISSPAQARLVQEKTLVAKPRLQTWESTDRGTAVYVTVLGRNGEIEQHWISGCKANYPDRINRLYVWVRIKECGTPGRHPYIVRYLSANGRQKFRIRLTEAN